jgi:hypothetical protein
VDVCWHFSVWVGGVGGGRGAVFCVVVDFAKKN